MKKRVFLVWLLLVAFCTASFAFDWVQFAKNRKTYAGTKVNIISSNQAETLIEVEVGGFAKMKTKIKGKEYYQIRIPNAPLTREKGAPELPYISLNLAIPNKGDVKVEVNEQTVSFNLDAKVLPSKGPILRTQDPEKVPYTFGPVYKEAAYYPDKNATLSKPFILRHFRGVTLRYYPVRYNPQTDELIVAKFATIVVKTGRGKGENELSITRGKKKYEKEMLSLYGNTFKNFRYVFKKKGYDPVLEKDQLLIITPDEFADALKPFVAWKKKAGFEVKVAKLSETGKTNTQIKNYIQNLYNEGKVCYIILVGDNEFVPCLRGVKENAPSDPCYTKLAGDDNIPDAMISRISAKTAEDVAYQCWKFVQYESKPFTGAEAAWYQKGIGIASAEGNPTDYERCEELRAALEAYTYTKIDKVYDPGASKSQVAAGINDGRGIINYIGHGSKTYWVTSRFGVYDCKNLQNGLKMPVIWDVACVNGQFNYGSDCFAEAFLKAGSKEDPKGAVMMFASSTNQEWVPPCVVQKEINNELICKEKFQTVGGLAVNGILKGFEVYGEGNYSSGTMMMEQWHIFGDCSLKFRTKAPARVKIKSVRKVGKSIFVSLDGNRKDLENITITCYDKDLNHVQIKRLRRLKGCQFKNLDRTPKYITVTGFNIVPIIDYEVK